MACNFILSSHRIKHELTLDSRALFDTISTLLECREYRLRQTIQMLRNSFESGNLHLIRWIPWTKNVSDVLTKRTVKLSFLLNSMCTSGTIIVDLLQGYLVNSETCCKYTPCFMMTTSFCKICFSWNDIKGRMSDPFVCI